MCLSDGVGGFAGAFGAGVGDGVVGGEFGEACGGRETGVGGDEVLACGADVVEVFDGVAEGG